MTTTPTTPHRIGQITKAEILIAHLLETTPPGTDHQRQAQVIVEQLQAAGWTAPPDPNADVPPLRPERVAAPEVQAAAMAEIRAVLGRPRDTPSTP
jgi:hypothetical protein